MKINSLKTLTSLAVAVSFLLAGSAFGDEKTKVSIRKPSKFYVEDGKHLQLCRDIKKILDDPINKDFGEPFMMDADFKIPKQFKDFALPKWEDIDVKDLPQYMAKDSERLQAINAKSEEEKSELRIQKTSIDLDHDGKNEVVLRIGLKKRIVDSSYVADADEQTVTSREFNKKHSAGFLFYYKGLIYRAKNVFDAILVYTPEAAPAELTDLYMLYTCAISLKPDALKAARTALYKYNKMIPTNNK